VLRAFTVDETIAFFRELGVALHEEPDGKLFPDSNRARDVLDALLREVAASGVHLLAGHRVLGIERAPRDSQGSRGFRLQTSHGDLESRAVVLASGGRSLPKSGSDGAGYLFAEHFGHTIVATTPGLVPLILADETGLHRELSGVAHQAELTVWVDGAAAIRLRGSLLWTHFGVSGPVALNASRHWVRLTAEGRTATMTVSFWPGEPFDAVDWRLVGLAAGRPKASAQTAMTSAILGLPGSVAAGLLKRAGIDADLPLSQLPRDSRRRLAHALVEWKLPVTGTRGYNYAEVTSGGVSLAEIDPSTMESRVRRGLYLVGEVLDVDGRIGGFNFQWAWSSARAAARGLSR
jgi:predicted Rossmann fold flavoprotein